MHAIVENFLSPRIKLTQTATQVFPSYDDTIMGEQRNHDENTMGSQFEITNAYFHQ